MFGEVQSTSAYWNLMKIADDPKARKTIGPVKRDDGTLALDDQEKACIMNSYLTTVGLNLANDFPPITGKRQGANSSLKDDRTVPLLIKEVHVSGLAIRNKLEALNANRSMGPDNIQLKLMKLAGGAIIPFLESLCRYSIQTETVFTSWKTARITPVFKKDDETDMGNYRPISLLSVPSKILESLVNDALVRHSFNAELISDKQWAGLTTDTRQNRD